jgi:hypothetical protein
MPTRRLHDEKAHEAAIKRQMAAAVAAYVGPVTKCPPGAARAEQPVQALLRPRYRSGWDRSVGEGNIRAAHAVKRETEEERT